MNKLVSRNLIQRFKQGRKIQKASLGNILERGFNAINKFTPPEEGAYYEKKDKFGNIVERGRVVNGRYQAFNNLPERKSKKSSYNSHPSSQIVKKNWEDEFKNNFLNNLTTEQKAYLTNAGVDYNKVGDVQSYLMNQLNTDLGGYKDDGKWGRNSINAWNQFVSKTDFTPKIQSPVSPQPISFNTTPSTPQIPNLNVNKIYNRSDIRDLIRERTGKSAYNFNGAQRKALRMVMNGTATDEDRALVQGMGIFKQGGNILPSRNIVKRFKQRNLLRK